jgi:two-component system phosphate regulon response regulator PhoB
MSAPKRKIQIIEDNTDIQQLYRYAFEGEGYEVKTSDNGLDGVNTAVEYVPDIILLDIMMPEMNGFEVLEALKNNTSLKVPVVVISNLTQEQEKQKALQRGADMYLIKSDYEGPDLVAKISAYLDAQKTA